MNEKLYESSQTGLTRATLKRRFRDWQQHFVVQMQQTLKSGGTKFGAEAAKERGVNFHQALAGAAAPGTRQGLRDWLAGVQQAAEAAAQNPTPPPTKVSWTGDVSKLGYDPVAQQIARLTGIMPEQPPAAQGQPQPPVQPEPTGAPA